MGAKQETNPLYQSFIDPNFLTNWPLNHENVLDYFSNKDNPFYDARCNNGVSYLFFVIVILFCNLDIKNARTA